MVPGPRLRLPGPLRPQRLHGPGHAGPPDGTGLHSDPRSGSHVRLRSTSGPRERAEHPRAGGAPTWQLGGRNHPEQRR